MWFEPYALHRPLVYCSVKTDLQPTSSTISGHRGWWHSLYHGILRDSLLFDGLTKDPRRLREETDER